MKLGLSQQMAIGLVVGAALGPAANVLAPGAPALDSFVAWVTQPVGTLTTIAPRRFNPEGKSWLPVMHTRRGAWHFTALFSNTARAHELGRRSQVRRRGRNGALG